MTHRDRVFVLAVEVPFYLEGDVYQPLDRDINGGFNDGGSPIKKEQRKGQRFHGFKEVKEREDAIFGLKSSKYCKCYFLFILYRTWCRASLGPQT